MRELEEMKRKANKHSLNQKGLKLGKFSFKAVEDIWEEGEEFIKLNNKIKEIAIQKIDLDNLKKKIKKNEKEIKEINQKKAEDINNQVKLEEMNINNIIWDKNIPIPNPSTLPRKRDSATKEVSSNKYNLYSDLSESELNDQLELIEFNKNSLIKVYITYK